MPCKPVFPTSSLLDRCSRRDSRQPLRQLLLDRCSGNCSCVALTSDIRVGRRRGSTSSVHGVVRCSNFQRPCRSPALLSVAAPGATPGNRSLRCSTSWIPAVVPPPSDLHGWRKCNRIVGTILALESYLLRPCSRVSTASYTPSLRDPVRNAG